MAAGILSVCLFAACKKEMTHPNNGGTNNGGNSSGDVTQVGTPTGALEEKTIGPGGGIFTTADNRLTIEFPAGALTAETSIGVQPISNFCPGAAGTAYRITPHLNLEKPAKLTFHYQEEDVAGSAAPLLGVAFQNEQQVWETAEIIANDTVAKKLTIATTHFSDWSLFRSLELVPDYAKLNFGESRLFQVRRVIPASGADELPVPVPGTFLSEQEATNEIREWKLIGAGALSPAGANATYTAPTSVPAFTPVINVRLKNAPGNMELTLVANITILWEGARWRVDGGPWQKGISPTGVLTPDGTQTLWIEGEGASGESIMISWKHTMALPAAYAWALTGVPSFFYDRNGSYYEHIYPVTPGISAASPGALTITEYNATAGGYVSGTFVLEKATNINPCAGCAPTIHTIEGAFRVKWGG